MKISLSNLLVWMSLSCFNWSWWNKQPLLPGDGWTTEHIKSCPVCFFFIGVDFYLIVFIVLSIWRSPVISTSRLSWDKYWLVHRRVLWLAGNSSWSSPHKKLRRRVTSFWSSGLGIGWDRSSRGVSLGRIRGGWSRKLSKMSKRVEKSKNRNEWWKIISYS